MKLLALETSTERLSLAILRDGLAFTRDINAGQRHSELAMPALQDLLREAGLALREMDTIAFGQGPGSFTGVRIACGLAQGIALGIGKLIVPVHTQMALAEQTEAEKVIVAVDARMGEIYFAAYRRDTSIATGWEALVAPILVKPDDLPNLPDGDWLATGSGFDVPELADRLTSRFEGAAGGRISATVHGFLPRALDVARIAARQIERAGIESAIPPDQAAPLYLRNKVAMTIDERRAHHAAKASATAVAP